MSEKPNDKEREVLATLIERGRLSLRIGDGKGEQVERDLTDFEEELICTALRCARSAGTASVEPRGGYEPLTKEHVERWRRWYDFSFQNDTFNGSTFDRLCDMAESSLLYAEEIQRLRAQSASEPITEVRNYVKGLMHSCPTHPDVVRVACELNALLGGDHG